MDVFCFICFMQKLSTQNMTFFYTRTCYLIVYISNFALLQNDPEVLSVNSYLFADAYCWHIKLLQYQTIYLLKLMHYFRRKWHQNEDFLNVYKSNGYTIMDHILTRIIYNEGKKAQELKLLKHGEGSEEQTMRLNTQVRSLFKGIQIKNRYFLFQNKAYLLNIQS